MHMRTNWDAVSTKTLTVNTNQFDLRITKVYRERLCFFLSSKKLNKSVQV